MLLQHPVSSLPVDALAWTSLARIRVCELDKSACDSPCVCRGQAILNIYNFNIE
jgi:hypothetical protein